jgi:hypothetical protein
VAIVVFAPRLRRDPARTTDQSTSYQHWVDQRADIGRCAVFHPTPSSVLAAEGEGAGFTAAL